MCFADSGDLPAAGASQSGNRVKRRRRETLVSHGLDARHETKQNREAPTFQRKKHSVGQAVHGRHRRYEIRKSATGMAAAIAVMPARRSRINPPLADPVSLMALASGMAKGQIPDL